MAAGVLGSFVLAGGIGFGLSQWQRNAEPAATSVVPTSTTTAPPPTTVPVTVAPGDLVMVDEVWLVDRGDGVYDWGVIVLTPPLAPERSAIEIDVRLLDADDAVVARELRVVDNVDDDSPGAAIGQLIEPESPPVRLEFDITVGEPSNGQSFDDVLAARGLVRRDDELVGRVASSSDRLVSDVVAAFVWRDEGGDVVAMALQPIDEVRPGSNTELELDLSGLNVPDGRPDDVLWFAAN